MLRTHSGNPDFCNDEQIVPALERIGVAAEDARDFTLSGCHEVIVTGRAQMGSVEGFINMPKVLRLALGLEPGTGPGADLDAIEQLRGSVERSCCGDGDGCRAGTSGKPRPVTRPPPRSRADIYAPRWS